MNKISIEEFEKLSQEEKWEQYRNLSQEDKRIVNMRTVPKGKVIGHQNLTKIQKQEAKEFRKAVKSGKINEWLKKKIR